MRRLFLVLFISSLCFATTDSPFQKLSFDAALKKAKQDKTLLFVDFYADWCGPCKLLDRTTFKDERVVKLLGEEVVALKINAEVKAKLAKKYNVQGFPSLVFINNDGTLRDTLLGYRDADDFLRDAKAIIKGKSELDVLGELYKANPDDKKTYFGYLDKLQESDPAKAFELLKPTLDRLATEEPKGMDTRAYSILRRNDSKQAEAYLETAYEAIEKKVLSGDFEKHEFKHYARLAYVIGDRQAPVEAYDKLRAGMSDDQKTTIGKLILGDLRRAGRYQDIEAIEPVTGAVEEVFDFYNNLKENAGEAAALGFLRSKAGDHYQTFLGLGRIEEGNAFADRVLAEDTSADTYNSLAWGGYLTKANTERNLDFAKKGLAKDPTSVAIFDTMARLMVQLGQGSEALTMAKEWQEKIPPESRSYRVITDLIKDLSESEAKNQG